MGPINDTDILKRYFMFHKIDMHRKEKV